MHRDHPAGPARHDAQLAAWREAYRKGMGRGSESCPSDETLTDLALGQLEGDERLTVADHLVACGSCADSYRTLRELHDVTSEGRSERWRWPLRGALAAAAVALLALGLQWLVAPPEGDPGADALRRGHEVAGPVRPPDGAVLPRAPEVLSWPAQAGASSYRVHLFDATAEPIWVGDRVNGARVDLPEAVTARLEGGGSYFWVVRVAGSSQHRELGPFWFEVRG